ncbi:MAG: aspartate ammonia-lyase [Turicibacter sp.]|nr:aspartate ammonia-lyase [Turicibacter sp.]
MEAYRIEKDSLGEMRIPAAAYYGVQTIRAIENFPITGYKLDTEFIHAMAFVKKAAAHANMETGQLDAKIGTAISRACDEILGGKWHDQFMVDPIQGGAGTSSNMNMNEVLANRALELLGEEKGNYKVVSPNTHVNMSQSTNDVLPTAANIAIIHRLQELLFELETLYKEFLRKAEAFDDVIKMGRTHLQDAVPIRLGQEFKAYALMLKRDIKRIRASRNNTYEVNIGATAVGTGLNADMEYIDLVVTHLCDYTDMPIRNAPDLIDGTANTDGYLEISGALKTCMLNLSKIANDLRLMASGPHCGLGEINLPPRQPGSSIMPGKVNPVMLEVVNQVAFQVAGNDLSISMAAEAGQFEINVMKPAMIFKVLESATMMKNVMEVFNKFCLQGITANRQQMEAYVNESAGTIAALNPHLGYELSAQLAKEVLLTHKSIRETVLEKGLLTEEELQIILQPHEMTNPGIAGKELIQQDKVDAMVRENA